MPLLKGVFTDFLAHIFGLLQQTQRLLGVAGQSRRAQQLINRGQLGAIKGGVTVEWLAQEPRALNPGLRAGLAFGQLRGMRKLLRGHFHARLLVIGDVGESEHGQ